MSKLETPSVLAFESKLICSDGVMFSGNFTDRDLSNWTPICVREKAVRGTISNRLKGAKASKMDAKIESPNPQIVDTAALGFNSDTLKVVFTLRVLGQFDVPTTCNNPEYQEVLSKKIRNHIETKGLKELSIRYATNLANGRFLWRNRFGAQEVAVRVSTESKVWEFDALQYPLKSFDKRDEELLDLARIIESGLLSESVVLKVEAYSRLGEAQTVFPSQEMVLNSSSDKSKILYQVDSQAAMHSQKLGNALRTIDTDYLIDATEPLPPISVEPYGSVTTRGIAYRQPKLKNDFYSLFDAWMIKDAILSDEQMNYVIAMLIRGGVFGAV